jgi:hypothetical protein
LKAIARSSLLVAAALAGGCAVVAGLDDDRRLAPDASSSAGGGGASAATSTTTSAGGAGSGAGACVSATYPDPPGAGHGGGVLDLVAAVHSLDLGEAEGAVVGLDLDGKCTCDGDGPSCLAPAFAEGDACDGPGGRDNATARVFAFMTALLGEESFSSASLSGRADAGAWSLLFRVREYNGTADDDRVEVDVYPSSGGIDPAWNGEDRWPVSETSVAPGGTVDDPLYVDTKAYVSGGTLVASLSESSLILGSDDNQMVLDLTAGFVTARVVVRGGALRLEGGTLAARWRLTDVFKTLSTFRDTAGTPVCTDDLLYDTVKDQICGFVDIYSALGTPTDECDSLSLGIGFEAEPAKLGDLQPGPTPGGGCSPETDPLYDSCGG